ncbi:MAG TPA: T9SS type A sorting domain-containing protein [Cyclobacteriaceae bacterium]|nr:T9SS type A sorting domain-containing protein [Cyclobacteriaceae bacterium]
MKRFIPVVICLFLSISAASAQSVLENDRAPRAVSFQADNSIPRPRIDVFPNPAIENIFVRIETGDLGKVEFELFNIIGTSIKIETEEIEKDYFRIGVKELPAGYYLLMVKDPVKRFNQAFKVHKANK